MHNAPDLYDQARLEAARLRVEKIVMGAQGAPGVEAAEFN